MSGCSGSACQCDKLNRARRPLQYIVRRSGLCSIRRHTFWKIPVLNRAALIVRYKQPFVDWINATEPDSRQRLKLADANDNNSAYLIEVDDEDDLPEWLQVNSVALMEAELSGWYPEESLWPKERSLALFNKWCAVELHTLVFDTGETPLRDRDG
jgi:hypothetical protein